MLAVMALTGLPCKPIFEETSGAAVEPAIGGPFVLVSSEGKSVSDRDLRGRYLVVFFGYTACPDICPTPFAKIARVLRLLSRNGPKLQAVFITVDPARDTPSPISAYTQLFSDNFLGLTGSAAAIGQAEAAYHVFVGPRNPQTGAISHSALIYLMGPDGRFMTMFPDNETTEAIAATIMKLHRT